MNNLTPIVLSLGTVVFGAVAAVFSYAYLHEGSHYLVGRTQTDEVEIQFKFGIFPRRVWFHKPYELSPNWIRLAGLAPAITGMVLTVWFALRWGVPETILQFIVSIAALFTPVLSPPDLLAVFFPEEFQRQSAEGFNMTKTETLRYILARLYPG